MQEYTLTAQSVLGTIDADRGRREEAVNAGRQAAAMLPTSRDAIILDEERSLRPSL